MNKLRITIDFQIDDNRNNNISTDIFSTCMNFQKRHFKRTDKLQFQQSLNNCDLRTVEKCIKPNEVNRKNTNKEHKQRTAISK